MRPIRLVPDSVNHRSPSEPVVISSGKLLGVGRGYSVIWPLLVMRPIWLALVSTNQRAPSGPRVMPCGLLPGVGIGNSVICPLSVMRAILFVSLSVNHWLPSNPTLISPGKLLGVGMVYSVMEPGLEAARTLPAFRPGAPTSMNATKLSLIHTFQRRDVRIVIALSDSFEYLLYS